ncbi:hypothetical protein O6P43_013054 [Quillaja saponaria]|uniref:Uncharacterized protein n=1 Tax=Quillaja saponaria TaxID=32244 RepID=A0AAD7M338_QUISA|nr:hypothetical protein O6P43_013054 [Quillaja saponaria]
MLEKPNGRWGHKVGAFSSSKMEGNILEYWVKAGLWTIGDLGFQRILKAKDLDGENDFSSLSHYSFANLRRLWRHLFCHTDYMMLSFRESRQDLVCIFIEAVSLSGSGKGGGVGWCVRTCCA